MLRAAIPFIRREIVTRGERAGLKLLDRIADIASDSSAVRVLLLFRVVPLQVVPLDDFRTKVSLHSLVAVLGAVQLRL
jgi:hypothetical protein